jgi:hypothetical protein
MIAHTPTGGNGAQAPQHGGLVADVAAPPSGLEIDPAEVAGAPCEKETETEARPQLHGLSCFC